MLIGLYPTLLDERGLPRSVSIHQFLASDSLQELKPYAVQAAREERQRQFIARYGNDYVLFSQYWRWSAYFQGKLIVTQFAATSGKETVPQSRHV